MLAVSFKNQVVGTSEKDGKEINTTLDIKAEGDKTGLNIDAVMNNIKMYSVNRFESVLQNIF